jgi:alginate O-acetyltransferase complex protein AlgI
MGVAWATMVVFIVSGLIHDLILSVPVHGGWGRPTIYFVLQGIGLLAERSRLGRRLGCARGFMGRLVCGLFVVAPLGLLFHEPFIRQAILPTLAALGIR